LARPPKPATVRKPRADARRNRDRLLEVAKVAFTRDGAEINLDNLAKQAGLGVGTLYRHFPTRDALIEAVYHAEVEGLALAATRLSQANAPLDALREWMRLFVDYIATKNLIAPALNSMVGGPSQLYATSGELVKVAIRTLVGRAVESGDIRPDLDPFDLLRALVGVANVAASPDWEASAKRLVDILLLGSKPAGRSFVRSAAGTGAGRTRKNRGSRA
jgi:AcrR family transcriptional regulator